MQPKLELLNDELIQRILDEAFQLLMNPGVRVQSPEARKLLAEAGADVDDNTEIAHIPESVARKALETVPHEFFLYDLAGEPTVRYGGDAVHFDPGSSGVSVLDPDSLEHKSSTTPDLIRLVKVAEMLPQYDAQSTAVVCGEVSELIGDLYRLYILLLFSSKPIVTGAFSAKTTQAMFDILAIFAGGRQELAEKPRAVFDVCPSPPLVWTDFGADNLIDLARAGVPAQIVSMPLAGAGAPVTLLGSVTQHAAECISGMTIHQLAKAGSPIVWGGAAAIMDMRTGTTPMGAIETAMIDASYAQVGKSLGFPTHTYLGASDSKLVDVQAGLESGISAVIGALAGINMISGAGMLNFLISQSAEKLVIDAEAIAMAQRLLEGMQVRTETLATALFEGINFKGDFLKKKETRKLYKVEQNIPSSVIDRASVRGWQQDGGQDAFGRAKTRANELLAAYQRPEIPEKQAAELQEMVEHLARGAGMDKLPKIDLQ